MVGTPPALFTFSRSINCMASSGSHLRISTILPPVISVGFSTAKQPVAWKNGTDSNVAALRIVQRIGHGHRLATAQEIARGGAARCEDVRIHVAMGAERAFRLARRAGGIKDRGVVIGRERHIWHRKIGQLDPVVHRAEHIFQPRDNRMGQFVRIAADIDALQIGAIHQMLGDALQPLGIDDANLRAGIDKAVFQLRPRPPRIQWRDDGADDSGRIKRHRPFRQIAHDDGDAVALLHALLLEFARHVHRGAVETLERHTVVFIDDEFARAIHAAHHHHLAQGGRHVLPHARFHAAYDGLIHFEARAGRGEKPVGLGQAHGGPAGLGFVGGIAHIRA